MSNSHPLDKTITGELPPIRTIEDIREIEKIPYADRLAVHNTYECLKAGTSLDPAKAAIHFLLKGEPEEEPITVTHGQLMGRINQTANMLHDLGVGPTDVVSYMLPLVPQAYFVLFGSQAAGIVSAVNPLLETGQIVEILKAAKTKVLVALGPLPGSEIWEKAQAVRRELPGLKAVIQVMGPGDEKDGVYSFESLVEKYPADRLVSGRGIAPEDICSYFHTGGTTGLPKLAQHTHANQIYQAWAITMMLGFKADSVIPSGLPLFHVTGAIGALVQMANGGTIVLLSPAGFRNPTVIRNYWKISAKYRSSLVFAVPTVLSALIPVPVEDADLSSIGYTLTGATSVPVEVGRAMEEKLGKPLVEIYGMTEATGLTNAIPRDGGSRLGSTGLRCPYSEIKPVKLDANGKYERDCETDEIGVIAIKGPHVFPGYVQKEKDGDIFLEEGWLNSGDLGRLDRDEFLWITGRVKDLIIRGGHNIDPLVIEEALYKHPAVAIAAAVGQPDGHAGELPVAYVQPRPDVEATPQELLDFARQHIPERAANPVNLHFVDPMPMTLVGKVFKPQLRWDAARRVFSDLLAPLAADGVGVSVAVGSDATHGSLATVALTGRQGPGREAVEASVAEILAPFVLQYRLEWH